MRMTRAALRAQESEEALRTDIDLQLKDQGIQNPFDTEITIREDSDRGGTSDGKSSQHVSPERKVLRDITEDNYPTAELDDPVVVEEPVLKKAGSKKSKKTKGKAGKKKAVQTAEPEDITPSGELVTGEDIDVSHEVDSSVEESNELSLESNVEPQTDDVQETTTGLVGAQPTQFVAEQLGTAQELEPRTETESSQDSPTPYKAVEHVSKTPRFNPEIHVTTETDLGQSQEIEDSFVDSIKTRSPSKLSMSQTQDIGLSPGATPSRTPSRAWSSPRVEDSVAALDDLEDALEKISDDFSAFDTMQLESPSKKRKPAPQTPYKINMTSPAKSMTKSTLSAQKKTASKSPNVVAEKVSVKSTAQDRVKATESRPAVPTHRRVASASVVKKEPVVASKPVSKPKHGPSKSVVSVSTKTDVTLSGSPAKQAPAYMKKRVTGGPLVTSRPGFVPTKSTKPPTKSTFTLPGEATAARLKAQREERQKREEEAERKKKEFRARPVPSKTARASVMPRENKASLAQADAPHKQGAGEDKENVAPAKPARARPVSMVIQPKPEINRANSSAKRNTIISTGKNPITVTQPNATTSRVVSTASAVSIASSNPAASTSGKSLNRGKEVFSRSRQIAEDLQREKRDKEEAAKKARAEAAERGRQASREWAEKQKKKLLAEKEAKSMQQTVVQEVAVS